MTPRLRSRIVIAAAIVIAFVSAALAGIIIGRSMPADALDVVAQPYGEGCRADRPQFEAPQRPGCAPAQRTRP